MKAARLKAFGVPAEVVDCNEVEDPGVPAADEVTVEILAAPINPADLLLIEGKYATRPALPAPLGIEGAGRVIAVGGGVTQLAEGDLVMSLGRANWAERVTLKAEQTVKALPGIDPQQLAMLKVNPATAYLMLKRYRDLKPGDWVIQNAANSGVGSNVIRLAKAWGLKTVNVVRRASLEAPLTEAGADAVVPDGEDLAERVADATGGAAIALGIDAVAGPATNRLAACLAEEGVVVNYGLLSGQPCQLGADHLVFRGITLTGFWLAKLMRETPFAELQSMYAELMARVADGSLRVPVEAAYPLADIKTALAHAGREARGGKILLTPTRM